MFIVEKAIQKKTFTERKAGVRHIGQLAEDLLRMSPVFITENQETFLLRKSN